MACSDSSNPTDYDVWPAEGAQSVRELLPNSALLTVDMAGHASLGASGCAGFLTGQYLLDPSFATGIDGAFCPQEFNPFDVGGGGSEQASGPGVSPEVRSKLIVQTGYRPPT